MKRFYILGFGPGGEPNGIVGKKVWDDRADAERHAAEVLKSHINTPSFEIVEAVSVVQRVHAPIEVVRFDETSEVRKAA